MLKDRKNRLKWTLAVSANRTINPMDLLTLWLVDPGVQVPNAGDIVIEYHDHSERERCIISSEEFKRSLKDESELTETVDDKPWLPFRSREDFEFAELVNDAALNRPQIDKLIKLIQQCQKNPDSFTLRNHSDLKGSLESASKLLTPVIINLPLF